VSRCVFEAQEPSVRGRKVTSQKIRNRVIQIYRSHCANVSKRPITSVRAAGDTCTECGGKVETFEETAARPLSMWLVWCVCVCVEDKALHTVDELRNIRTTSKWRLYASRCTGLCV
jgi:hypothetical protein